MSSTLGISLQTQPPNPAEALPSLPLPSLDSELLLHIRFGSQPLHKQFHHTSGFASVRPTGYRNHALHAEHKHPDGSLPGVLNMASPISGLCTVLSCTGSSEKGTSLRVLVYFGPTHGSSPPPPSIVGLYWRNYTRRRSRLTKAQVELARRLQSSMERSSQVWVGVTELTRAI